MSPRAEASPRARRAEEAGIRATPEGFRAPRQERSRRTLERIADATEALLAERGPEGVTVQGVVARAETSVGAFYTRFAGKEDAVAFVRARFWSEARALWTDFLDPARWEGVAAVPLIAEVVRRFVRLFLRPDGRSRAFLLELLNSADPALIGEVRSLDREIARLLGRLLEQRVDGSSDPPASGAAEQAFRVVLGAIRDHLLFGPPEASPGAEVRSLILSLTRMYASLLGLEGAPSTYGELLAACAETGSPRGPPVR